MKKKTKLLYNILVIFTLVLPTSLYVLLTTLVVRIDADYIINTTTEEISGYAGDDYFFIYDESGKTTFNGHVVYDSHLGLYGIKLAENEILRAKNGYYSFVFDKETNAFMLKDIKAREVKVQQGMKIPIWFIVSAVGAMIVVAIISNKMRWHKEHPRLAVLVSLTLGTMILALLDFIIGNIFGVFIMATLSWALYYVEWLYFKNKVEKKTHDTIESDITKAIRKAAESL